MAFLKKVSRVARVSQISPVILLVACVFSLASFFFIFSLIIITPVKAATGINKQINFQGKLVDQNGLNVADGTYSIRLRIYTDPSADAANTCGGNSCVWEETQSSVSVSNGIFQVALGSVTALPGAVDFNSDSLYLGIKVQADNEMTPRIRFASVPYAFNAGALNGVVATQSATGFNLQGGTGSQSTVSFTTAAGALTLQPGLAAGLTIQSNGSNSLTLDSAQSIILGDNTANPSFSFLGTGGLTVANGGNNNITLGSNAGNGTVVIQSNAGGQAGLILADQGSGDLFTASAGASTKFTIGASGAITDQNYLTNTGVLYTDNTGVFKQTNGGSNGNCLVISGTTPGWGSCNQAVGASDMLSFGTYQGNSDITFLSIPLNIDMSIATVSASPTTSTADVYIRGVAALYSGNNTDQTVTLELRKNNCSGPQLATNQTTITLGNGSFSQIMTLEGVDDNPGVGTFQYILCETAAGAGSQVGNRQIFAQVVDNSGPQGPQGLQGDTLWKLPGAGVLTPANQTTDVLIGGTSTASAEFGFLNVLVGTPTASVSAGSAGGVYLSATGTLSTTARQTLSIGNSDSGNILIDPIGTSHVGIGFTSAPLAELDVRGTSGTLPAASVSGKSSFASLVVNNSGSGDLFTASSSGFNRFVIAQNGSVGIGTNLPTATLHVAGNGLFKNVSNSTTAFQILNSSGSNLFNADTTNDRIGIGTTAPATALDLRGGVQANGGTLAVASISSKTTFASLVVDNTGAGDIFTASSGGVPHFTVSNTGSITDSTYTINQGILYADNTGLFHQTVAPSGGTSNCLSAALNWVACSSGPASTNYWQSASNGVISPFNDTYDLLVGGTATTSADFHIFGASAFQGTKPVASVAANTSFAGLVVDNKGAGDIFTASSSGVPHFTISNNGAIIASNYQLNGGILYADATGKFLQLQGAAHTLLHGNGSGAPSFNAVDLTQSTGDVANTLGVGNGGTGVNSIAAGTLLYGAGTTNPMNTLAIGSANSCLLVNSGATAPTWGSCALGTNYWQSGSNGALSPFNDTYDLLVGGTATSSAEFHIYGASAFQGTNPVASVAAKTSYAGLVIDNSGKGDVLAASTSGLTRFVIKQNGTVVIGNNTDGLTFDSQNGGPTYGGLARPTKQIILSPEFSGAVLTASDSAGTGNHTGNMTSDASASATLGIYSFENYYEWKSSQSSLNDYTVAVRVTLPPDFSSWAPGGTAMQVAYNTNLKDALSDKLDVYIYNSDLATSTQIATPVVQRLGLISAADKTWTSLNLSASDFAGSSPWNTASQSAVIYLKMYSKNNLYTQVGDIILNYLSRF